MRVKKLQKKKREQTDNKENRLAYKNELISVARFKKTRL